MIEPIENLLALELDMLTYGENMSTLNGIRIDPSAFCIEGASVSWGDKKSPSRGISMSLKAAKKQNPKQNYLKLAKKR